MRGITMLDAVQFKVRNDSMGSDFLEMIFSLITHLVWYFSHMTLSNNAFSFVFPTP